MNVKLFKKTLFKVDSLIIISVCYAKVIIIYELSNTTEKKLYIQNVAPRSTLASERLRYSTLSFMCHYLQHHFVGLVHSLSTNAGKVFYRFINIIVDDAFYRTYALALDREQSRK